MTDIVEPIVTEQLDNVNIIEPVVPVDVKPIVKKPRSDKQIAAFQRAQDALKIRRDLVKAQKAEGIVVAKKSKKKEKLVKTFEEAGISNLSEDRVIEIINQQKATRKANKTKAISEKAQKIKDAKALLGITDDKPVKVTRKRVAKPPKLRIHEDLGETREQVDRVKENYQQPKEMYQPEPEPAYNYQSGW